MNKVDLSKYNIEWRDYGAGRFKDMLWYATNAFFLNCSWNILSGFKVWILKRFGAKIGHHVNIKTRVSVKYPWMLEIGDYVWIGEGVWLDNNNRLTIGSNVVISQGAKLMGGNHNYKKSTFDLIVGNITLEDGVWIGAHSIVTPGVTAHTHSILTVGSVATKDMEAYGIYQGNPAVKVKERVIDDASEYKKYSFVQES